MNPIIKIETQSDWDAIRNMSPHSFYEVVALHVDNTFDKFIINYDFIRSISKATKRIGFCDLQIKDINTGLNDLYFLKDTSISQIHIDSPDVTLNGIDFIKDFSSFVFLTAQHLDLSPLKAHQEQPMFTLAMRGKSLAHIDALSNFPCFEYLCLEGAISDCNVFKQFSSFKDRCNTELYLDNNLIENLECFEQIFVSGLSLNQNKVKDISNLTTIINHNLKQCNRFSLSLQDNPIEPNQRLAFIQQKNIRTLIENRSLILDF